uniref:Coiled-coil domain-containing protein 39 n=1 Tax=Gouania willdenowi TaxID=441366 RepID=A0A8C5G6P1_GOUWI
SLTESLKFFPLPNLNVLNTALLKEIYETQRELLKLDTKLEKNKVKIQSTEQLMQNVNEINKNTHTFIKVKESEIEVEKHFIALKNGTKDHLAQKSAKTMEELQSLTERETKLKDGIFKSKQKLEMCRRQKNWDQQTMDAFLKESAQKHEGSMALMKYAHQDNRRIKSLTGAIEKEAMDVSKHRKALDKAKNENKSAQITLDKAKDNMHQALVDTQQFFYHLENSSKQMEQPDAEMQKCAQVLVQTRQEVGKRELTLSECKHLLNTQKNNNKETERKLMLAKQQAIELQQHLDTEDSNLHQLQSELSNCQNEVNKSTSEVKSLKARVYQIKKEMGENDDRSEQTYTSYSCIGALEKMLQVLTQTTLSETESNAQMKHFLTYEQQAVNELDLQLRVRRQKLIDSKQHLEDAKASEKSLTIKVSESKSTITILEEKCKKEEEEQRTLKKIAFQHTSEITALKNILVQLQGNDSPDAKQMMDVKIAELTKDLEEKQKTAKNLTNAIKESDREIKRLNGDKQKSEGKKTDLFNKNKELLTLCDLTENDLMRLRLLNQEKLAQTQHAKTVMERLHHLLHKKTKSMHSSEIKKLDLLKAMKERELEIQAEKEMLSRQLHITEQETHKLRLEHNEKLHKLDLMKNRCEILVSSILPEVEADEAQAYCITKFEQEKEELMQKRYALDAQIQKVELENKALENTNLLWQHRTSSICQHFNKVDETRPEYQKKLSLEEQLKEVQDVLKSKEREIQHLQTDIQEKEKALQSVQHDQQEVNNQITVKRHLLAKLQKQAHVQQESINRLKKQCAKLTKEIRQAENTQEEILEEKHIRLMEAKQFSNKIDQMLTEARKKCPDLGPVLEGYFQEANILFPSPSPAQGSQQTSRASFGVNLRAPASSINNGPRSSVQSAASLKTVTLSFNPPSPPNITSGRPSTAGRKSKKTITKKKLS